MPITMLDNFLSLTLTLLPLLDITLNFNFTSLLILYNTEAFCDLFIFHLYFRNNISNLSNAFRFKNCLLVDLMSRVVYKFQCGRCNSFYYGDTEKHLKVRSKNISALTRHNMMIH